MCAADLRVSQASNIIAAVLTAAESVVSNVNVSNWLAQDHADVQTA